MLFDNFYVMKLNGIPLSILDLSLVREGYDFAQAFADSIDYIQMAERMGFKRFWLAEHHNASGIASSSTAVVIGHLAEKTSKIRIGSGGIMLPNHSPLQVAETFGTLETLYPGRIDLGVGRAPGTDPITSHALRRDLNQSVEQYPEHILEILRYLGPHDANMKVNAYPGVGTQVPLWILGSSLYSARLAAYLGLPYAFASHFAPTHLLEAKEIYKSDFKSSRYLNKPYFMPAANIVVAETTEKAEYLATSFSQMAANIVTRKSAKLQPPVEDMDAIWSPEVKVAVHQMRTYSFVGNAELVKSELNKFIELTGADELMLTSYFYDPADRLKSFELLASA